MPDPETRLQELVEKIRQRGGRLTPQRVAVLKVLVTSDRHPSVEQIYDQIRPDFPTTSLATIYKTVTLLKEMGEVLELGFAGGSNRYDGNRPYPHPHLVCTQCGEIRDLEVPALSEIVQQVSQDVGYRIVSHRLDLYGICSKCQSSGPSFDPQPGKSELQLAARRSSERGAGVLLIRGLCVKGDQER